MSRDDGVVEGVVKILDNGPDERRMNIVLVGDGFQKAADEEAWRRTADAFRDGLLAEDWYGLTNRGLNVHRVDVWSTDSGVDEDGQQRRTYFDSASNSTQGVIGADTALVGEVLRATVPLWHAALVVLKDSFGGGFSGLRGMGLRDTAIAILSWHLVPFAADPSVHGGGAVYHELGHAAFGLGDEYPCSRNPEVPCTETYVGPEPPERNLTSVTERDQLEWSFWVQDDVPIPTMRNEDCSDRTRAPNVLDDDFKVGLFEGASRYNCGIFRPAYSCKMRTNFGRFCPVCLSIIQDVTNPFWAPIECSVGDLLGSAEQPGAPSGGASGSSSQAADALRALRDRELTTRFVGQEYIALLKAHSREINRILARDEKLRARALSLAMRAGELAEPTAAKAEPVDDALLRSARELLDRLDAEGSPALRRAVHTLGGELEHLRGAPPLEGLDRAEAAWLERTLTTQPSGSGPAAY